jgi:hypothetical protein
MKRILIVLIAFLPLLFTGCQDDPDSGGTNVEALAGEWFVQVFLDGEEFDATYYHMYTYNTAANSASEIWIDADAVWPFTTKAPCNTDDLSFGTISYENQDFSDVILDVYGLDIPDTLTVIDGEILTGAATTSGGNTTDSIYININSTGIRDLYAAFGLDLPAGVYTIAGYRRTGFIEDEH